VDNCSFRSRGRFASSLRRAANVHWQAFKVDKSVRANQKLQVPACLWFTGPSKAGKSTIADLLEQRLVSEGKHTYLLDGETARVVWTITRPGLTSPRYWPARPAGS